MPTKNTIVVPCMVKSWLNTWGETKRLLGMASWMRISIASTPAIRRKMRAYPMYISPIFL